jgi:hypothetical protein
MIKDYPNLARLAAAEPEATLDKSMDMPESQGDVSADMTTGGDQ